MRSLKNQAIKLILFALLLLTATTVNAQDARLKFDNLDYLSDRAIETVEVNIDGKLLNLAKKVLLKVKDPDAKKVGEAINGLKGIYVRVFKFENDNEYNLAEVDAIRTQLQNSAWQQLANVRSKKKNQKIDVYTMFSGDIMSGVAVVISENRSIALVNVVGPIDIELLAEIGGKLNIPEISIENDDNQENPNK
jgi:hypothetical protein